MSDDPKKAEATREWFRNSPLHAFMRTAYTPVLEEATCGPTDSHYGGDPWMKDGEEWPVCAACKHPLQFFLQVNLGDAPKDIQDKFGTGLLQFFYCTWVGTESWMDPASGKLVQKMTMCIEEPETVQNHLVRIVDPSAKGAVLASPQMEKPFPTKKIVSWKPVEDYTIESEEYEGTDVDFEAFETEAEAQGHNLIDDFYEIHSNDDKLGGWPNMFQGLWYPPCKTCGEPMKNFLYEGIKYPAVDYEWGDGGTGYIFQCPEHRDMLAFTYQQ